MLKAGRATIPTKLLQIKGPRWKASPEVLKILRTCKEIYKNWQDVGKSKDHQLVVELKKTKKKKLRSKLRTEKALDRQKLYQEIMDNPNTQHFYRLINRNRNGRNAVANCININGKFIVSPQEQRQCFANYHEDLSLPKEDQYDNNYVNLCKIRQKYIQDALQDIELPDLFSKQEVEKAIDSLNARKSCDEFGLTAEHLKYAKATVSPILTGIFNNILKTRKVPDLFKTGILSPVLKREKDPTLIANYRGITVTAIIGKTFEFAFLYKLKLKSETELQFGFTTGLCPLMSSLVISESRYENKKENEDFLITLMDVKSAFDVVQHDIIMDKMWYQGIHPIYWKILTELYDGLSTKVKWLDGISSSFNIKQGVRQGGILSTHLYKIFVQDLLTELEDNSIGYHLGNIYVGAPTCADDFAFISKNKYEMQVMLNVVSRYAKEHHYSIHPTKTQLIDCSKKKSNYKWTLDNHELHTTQSGTHLGIIRSENNENSINVHERIQAARRTKYALMGSWIH